MKLADNLMRDNRSSKAAPLLLGMGLGALLMYAASSQRRQHLLPAGTLPQFSPGDRAMQEVSDTGRQAAAYTREHSGALTGVLVSLAGIGLATLVVKKSPQLRESLDRMASQEATHVSKSIEISASPQQVFDVWCEYDNFPRFMSMVKEVRSLGGDRSHWKVKGPAGIPVEWNSVITERESGRLLAWHSEEGSAVEHGGRVQLAPCPTGTRATVSMTYRPPGGRVGHVVASLFGRNPEQQLERDLQNMKTFIEGRGERPGSTTTKSAKPELQSSGI